MGLQETLAAIPEYVPGMTRPAPRFVTEEGRRVHGMIAVFDDPPTVYHAAERVRDAGYRRWDLNSPFPIHGIEEAMGVKTTRLPYLVFGAALTGVAGAWLMQQFMNNWDYSFVVQGKPEGAWEPFLPIMFELGVLLSAFTALFGMLAFNGLPRFNHPLFNSDAFLKSSDNRFVIAVEADDKAFDPEQTRELLESVGASEIEIIEDEA
ncbi:MAG: DUF3341 domain-containing protein [Planctomycetota bacterium]